MDEQRFEHLLRAYATMTNRRATLRHAIAIILSGGAGLLLSAESAVAKGRPHHVGKHHGGKRHGGRKHGGHHRRHKPRKRFSCPDPQTFACQNLEGCCRAGQSCFGDIDDIFAGCGCSTACAASAGCYCAKVGSHEYCFKNAVCEDLPFCLTDTDCHGTGKCLPANCTVGGQRCTPFCPTP